MKPLLFVLILAFCCLAGLPRQSAAQDKDGIYIIFDASGSMWGELPDKSRKVTVAKQVLEDFVAGDFEGYDLALRAYGHRRKGDCADTELVAPFGAPEQVIDKVKAFTKDLNPLGKTPISRSLRAALDDFGDRPGEIILISDGIETCDEDPCALVRSWREKDIDIKVHVVGLGLEEKEKAAMQCISEAAGTEYQDAESAETLAEGLKQIQEDAKAEQIERSTTIALRIVGKDATGERVRVDGVLRQNGEDRFEVTSHQRNVVEAGVYEMVAGVPTQDGSLYETVTKTVEVAGTGETTVEVEVTAPPSIYAAFFDGDEKQQGSLVRAYQDGEERFSFRARDTVFVQPGTYEFRATPNAENELSVTETVADGDFKEITFRMIHAVHVYINMVADGEGGRYRINNELWQDGAKKYTVHLHNGHRSVLPGRYEVRMPDALSPYHAGVIEVTQEAEQTFDFTVPVGYVTVEYLKAGGTRDKADRCFIERLGPEPTSGRSVYKTSGQKIPMLPGRYRVLGWRQKGTYDPVEFEVRLSEEQIVTLREKG